VLIKVSNRRHRATTAEQITIAVGTALEIRLEQTIPKRDLAESHVYLPGHRHVERLAATVRVRIDLPIDGLNNVGKPAIRRLTLLRVTDYVIQATGTRLRVHLYSILTGLDGSASRAVLICREGSLVSGTHVACPDHERGNRYRVFIAPGNASLDAGARVPGDVYSTANQL
jgi:hypothetical protein